MDEHSDGQEPAESIETDPPAPQSAGNSSRRDIIKKAAVGSGVAAAVWVAPRVDGLSLRPDYAAAGTARGTFTFNKSPATGNANFSVPTPSGTETISGAFGNSTTNGPFNISFASMDPPFNSNCKIVGATGSAPSGVGNVRINSVTANQVNWDIYNPFWLDANSANADSLTFTINC